MIVASPFLLHILSLTALERVRQVFHNLPSCSTSVVNPNGQSTLVDDSRRKVFGLAIGCLLQVPLSVSAAPPMTLGEAEGLGAVLERKLRAKPPKVIRAKLDQDFAVLLMRSSYNALDQIDCVAMDQFQRDFFLIRQAEYQPYIELLGPGVTQQGILTDPYYFDFISFAQYATISREINMDPLVVFEEQQPEDSGADLPQKFTTKVIRRDPTLTNNMLAKQHSQLVGDAIMDKLTETFRGSPSAIPEVAIEDATSIAILASLTQLMKLFLINGFAFDGRVLIVKEDLSGTEFCISLVNPATLWSGKALQQRKADPVNSFMLKASNSLINRAGLNVVSSSVKYEDNQEKTFLKVQMQ